MMPTWPPILLDAYWTVDETAAGEVEEAIASGVEVTTDGGGTGAASTMTVRVEVAVRPAGSVAT
jgi:hypothetical protein